LKTARYSPILRDIVFRCEDYTVDNFLIGECEKPTW
jgi:hypothetical protein